MRRFNYNDDHHDEMDNFFGGEYNDGYDDEDDDEDFGYMKSPGIMAIMQTSLATLEINRKIMTAAVHVAEKSFLWRFWPMKWKLAAIITAYHELDKLIDTNES